MALTLHSFPPSALSSFFTSQTSSIRSYPRAGRRWRTRSRQPSSAYDGLAHGWGRRRSHGRQHPNGRLQWSSRFRAYRSLGLVSKAIADLLSPPPYSLSPSSAPPRTTQFQSISGQAPGNTTIYVGNLVPYTSQADLIPLFQGFGYIVEIRMQADRGFAFVKLDTHENAANAIGQLTGTLVHGRQLKCSWGKDREGAGAMGGAPAAMGAPPQQQQYMVRSPSSSLLPLALGDARTNPRPCLRTAAIPSAIRPTLHRVRIPRLGRRGGRVRFPCPPSAAAAAAGAAGSGSGGGGHGGVAGAVWGAVCCL